MDHLLEADDLQKVQRFVNSRIGFSYTSDRISDLEHGFFSVCTDLGFKDPLTCLHALNEPTQAAAIEEALIKKITIGETYFFRDKRLFQLLKENLLPDLIRSRRTLGKYLRIWSAACSTGQEPYSLAILIRHLLPDIDDWNITILASDINPGSLHAAEKGIYSRWSFREEAPINLDRFIIPSADGRFQVSDSIKRMVRFSRLNLISDLYPSPMTGTMTMDLILCRNILMYFSPELASGVIDRLNTSLIEGGWLIVSPQEISYAHHPYFVQEKRDSVFLFRKDKFGEKSNTNQYSISTGIVETEPQKRVSDKPNSSTQIKTTAQSPSDNGLLHDTLTNSSLGMPAIQQKYADELSLRQGIPFHDILDPDTLIKAGRLPEAEKILLEEQKPGKQTIMTMNMLARLYADQGDSDQALGWCDRILASDPLFSGSYHLRAVIQMDKGDISAAIQSLRQALYAEPDYIPAHLMLGTIFASQGQLNESRRHYQITLDLLSLMPDNTPVDETDGMPALRVREMVRTLLAGRTS